MAQAQDPARGLASGPDPENRERGAEVGELTGELSRLKRSIHAGEERFRLFADSSPLMIWALDANGRVEYLNPAYLDFFGIKPDQEEAAQYDKLLHPDDRARFAREIGDALRERRSFNILARARRADGQWRWVHDYGAPRFAPTGEFLGLTGTFPDVTEETETERALRDEDRRKDDFIAVLAHELRNPLTPIRTAVEILRRKGPLDPELEWTREVIERQCDHMTRLIDDLLDIGRLTHGQLALREERMPLERAIDMALETSAPQIRAAAHSLSVQLPIENVMLDADPVRLGQAISNLLNNAAKYTPSGGEIALRVNLEGSEVAISVEDSGIGLPADAQERLFKPFSQLARPAERTNEGLGIGLALVKEIVTLHGGSVAAHSGGPGRGSEFVIHLPVAALEARGAPLQPAAADDVVRTVGLRVLLVDDNRDSADVLQRVLQTESNEVEVAYDGNSALAKFDSFQPGVAVVDIGIPGVDGYELARTVRSHKGGDIALVALTGWGQDVDRRRAAEAGFDYHLTKPVDPRRLADLLAKIASDRPEVAHPGV